MIDEDGIVPTLPKTFLTEEQYLEIERKAEFKSEYFNGEMFAMAGAREGHDLIAINVYAALHQQFRARPCRVHSSDMCVRARASGLYTYPDVSAFAENRAFSTTSEIPY